jgi:hypothetical protein
MLMLLGSDEMALLAKIKVFALRAVKTFVPDGLNPAYIALIVIEEVDLFGVGVLRLLDSVMRLSVEDRHKWQCWRVLQMVSLIHLKGRGEIDAVQGGIDAVDALQHFPTHNLVELAIVVVRA